jgi:hypothetical protein
MSTAQSKLALFAKNVEILKSEFVWKGALTRRMAALLYAQEGKSVDGEAIRKCHAMIKRNTGMFSAFRGNMALCIAALISLSPNPRDRFGETLKVYDLLKAAKFRASDFLVMAAHQIAAQSKPSDYEQVVTRTRSFYDEMKDRHFFYTGQDDYIFSAMLGLTDLDVAEGAERIERLYSRLKDAFWHKNSVQTLAQMLALGHSDDTVIHRMLALRDALRAQRIRLDKAYTLPILGVLTLLPVEIDAIVRDIVAAQDTLRTQKGFGSLSVTSQELLLFAVSIIAGDYAENAKDGVLTATLSTSLINIIMAQQAAMIAVIAASTAASASAASS